MAVMKRSSSIKPFSRLTAAQKRVAIARDILVQIKAKTTEIRSGAGYWMVTGEHIGWKVSQFELQNGGTRCKCCAAGAVVLSTIRLFDQVTIGDENGTDSELVIKKSLFFSRRHLALIESAFEVEESAHLIANRFIFGTDQYKKAVKFNHGTYGTVQRAVRIYQNIIKNGGTFKP